MPDRDYYPDEWKTYCARAKRNKQPHADQWSRFAARYRAAAALQGVAFMGFSDQSALGYSAGLRLLMSYSAFEIACTASGLKPYNVSVGAGEWRGAEKLKTIRSYLGQLPRRTFLLERLNKDSLRRRIVSFLEGNTDDLQGICAGLRHAIAHGEWSPTGGSAMTGKGVEILDVLSAQLLTKCDELLRLEIALISTGD